MIFPLRPGLIYLCFIYEGTQETISTSKAQKEQPILWRPDQGTAAERMPTPPGQQRPRKEELQDDFNMMFPQLIQTLQIPSEM